MIRTVPIPTKVSRMGCTPGADCCDECRSHVSGVSVATIPSNRNSALHERLGETQCDQDGNCYTDGVLSAAPLTTGSGCPPGVPNCSSGPSAATLYYIGAALAGVLLLEAFSRRR